MSSFLPTGSSRLRREPRVTLTPPLALTIRGSAPPVMLARLINISRSGTAILAGELLGNLGAVLVLDLPDGTATERVSLPCEVRWVLAERGPLPRHWLHGAQFAPLDAHGRNLVDHLVDVAGGRASRP